jgi:uncharacterized iron-regulated membrane protein
MRFSRLSFRNRSFRKIVHTLHRFLGLLSGLVMMIVAITGAIQAFEEELRLWLQREYLSVPRPTQARASTQESSTQEPSTQAMVKPSAVLAVMQREFPHEHIKQIRFRYATYPVKPDSTSAEIPAFLVLTESDHIYSIHPYTGYVLGARNMRTDALAVALELHTNLLLGRFGDAWHDVGEEIIKWNTLIFFVMLLSGIILWMPLNMRLLKNALKTSFRVRWRNIGNNASIKRTYDIHRVAGFYASGVMLLVSWTAMFWMFDIIEDSMYAAFGQEKIFEKKPKSSKPAIHQDAVALSGGISGGGSNEVSKGVSGVSDHALQEIMRFGEPYFVSLQLPKKETDALRLVVRYPYRFLRKQSVFYFDQYSGALIKSDLHEHYTVPDKVRVSNYDLHTGKILGLGGKILWFVAALLTASLPVTGLLLWWKKR